MRLAVRFEEFGDQFLKLKAPTKSTKNLNGTKDDRGDLQLQVEQLPSGRIYTLRAPGSVAIATPKKPGVPGPARSSLPQSSDDKRTFDIDVIPHDVQWAQNGIRAADTLHSVFRWVDFPLDPRLVRAIGVEMYLGTITAEEYAAHSRGLRAPMSANNSTEGAFVLPDEWTDQDGRPRSNLRFRGWVDKIESDWSAQGIPIVRIECRDNTSLFIEQDASPKLCLDAKRPIDEAVALLLSHYPQFEGMTVEYLPAGDTPPSLDKVLSATAFRPNLGPQPAKGAGSKLSIWDYLTDVVRAIGHSIRLEGLRVIIQRVRAFRASIGLGRADDPFEGRRLEDTGVVFVHRRMIWGRNLEGLKTARNFTKHVPGNIECRSYDPERKTMIVARFPEEADRNIYVIPGNSAPDQKWVVYQLGDGIRDLAVLKQAAQDYYEALYRNEFSVTMSTKNLASFGAGNEDPDLLDLHAGDAIEVLVDRQHDAQDSVGVVEFNLASLERAKAFMSSRGYKPEFAEAYALAYTSAHFITVFRTKTVKVNWQVEEGVKFDIQAVNYVEIRGDKKPTTSTPAPNTNPLASRPTVAAKGPPPPALPPPPTAPPAPPTRTPRTRRF
ncbi:MAG: hypothetical protein PVSMB8_02790 [Vulcanimicrobiaceae bacterium]